MPTAPKRHKPRHQKTKKEQDAYRPDATARGYDSTYRKLRAAFVIENPLCLDCLKEGKVTNVEHVHHEDVVAKHFDSRHDTSRWTSLCTSHHRLRHSGDGHTVWNTKHK